MKRNAFLAALMAILMVFTLMLPSLAWAEAADPTLVTIAGGALQGYEDTDRSLYIWLSARGRTALESARGQTTLGGCAGLHPAQHRGPAKRP